MAYRYETNRDTGQPELIIDGWENGIAESPYKGITSVKNFNIRYLPGAVYSNYKRILNTSATTVAIPKYWTIDPDTGVYYIVDSGGLVWQSSDPSTTAWTQLTGNAGHLGQGQGLVVYKGYLFVFKDTSVDYYFISGTHWVFDWQTGFQANVDHMAIWSFLDIMYFCNGVQVNEQPTVASIIPTPNTVFDPQDSSTFTYNPSAVFLPGFEASATWLTQLSNNSGANIIIAAGKTLYPWDGLSTNFNGVVPVSIMEKINRVVNIMNNLYITAGVKGNIYISNGYSISPFIKIPDSFFGVIDPVLISGDMMSHRNKLYVGYSLLASPFTNGIFSVALGVNTYGTEVAGAINFENENSYGPNASGVTAPYGQPSVLIDLEAASVDTYASAWYDGTKGGMDKNTNIIYTNFETVIESDLIPVGTFLNKKTFDNIEFKLDKPLAGTIKISIRQSLSDSYVQIGTTTSSVISDVYTPLSVENFEWIQFKIELASTSNTVFNRLREIRIRSATSN